MNEWMNFIHSFIPSFIHSFIHSRSVNQEIVKNNARYNFLIITVM